MFCTNCGNQIADNTRFCPKCGTATDQTPVSGRRMVSSGTPSNATQQQTYIYTPPQTPNTHTHPRNGQNMQKGLPKGLLVGMIAGGFVLLGLLVFFGLRFLGDDNVGGIKTAPSAKEVVGTWRGMLSFDEWFPEDGTVSTLVYASEDGNLPCVLHVAQDGDIAELVVRDVTIPLVVGTDEHTLIVDGSFGDERISMNIAGEREGLLSGSGDIAVGREVIPFTLRFAHQSDETPELRGASGTLPQPPEQNAPPSAGDIVTEPDISLDGVLAGNLPALMDVLPGTWALGPDFDFSATVFAFTEDGLMAHGSASATDETTLENWGVPGIWVTDHLTWREWTLHGDTVIFNGCDNADEVRIIPKSEDLIVIYYEGSEEGYEFQRMGGAPSLAEYIIGTWVPDTADENGNHAALTLNRNGSAIVTGAKGVINVTPEDWGDEGKWEILGTKEGSWQMKDGQVLIEMSNGVDAYSISINGPNNATFSFGANWETAYTRIG